MYSAKNTGHNAPITASQQKAKCFNLFASVGVTDTNFAPHYCNDIIDIILSSVLDSITISETDVIRSIDKLRSNSCCGPDLLPPMLFKCIKFCLSRPLALMYNQLISDFRLVLFPTSGSLLM